VVSLSCRDGGRAHGPEAPRAHGGGAVHEPEPDHARARVLPQEVGAPVAVGITQCDDGTLRVLRVPQRKIDVAIGRHGQMTPGAEIVGDDGYTKYSRIRTWAQKGVSFLTSAVDWTQSPKAQAYHRFLSHPENAEPLAARRTAIESFFDLVSQVLGTTDNHKQLPLKGLANVRTCLAMGILMVQIAMIVNSIW